MFGPGLIARSKTFVSESPPIKQLSLFHYNTTIVDLRPFDAFSESESENHNSSYSYNDLYAEFYPRNELFHLNTQNQLVASPKKYLINRNMKFFEPVKDAEMLVQLKSLRSKLKDQANVNENVVTAVNKTNNINEGQHKYSRSASLLPRKKPQITGDFALY